MTHRDVKSILDEIIGAPGTDLEARHPIVITSLGNELEKLIPGQILALGWPGVGEFIVMSRHDYLALCERARVITRSIDPL